MDVCRGSRAHAFSVVVKGVPVSDMEPLRPMATLLSPARVPESPAQALGGRPGEPGIARLMVGVQLKFPEAWPGLLVGWESS